MKVAAGLIVFRKTANKTIEYLLLKASYPPFHWTPPKGHVDPGESELTCAFRETEEEAGLKKSDLQLLEGFQHILNYDVRGRNKKVTYWLAELITNTEVQLSKEHTQFKWAEKQEATELVEYKDSIDMLNTCQEYLHGIQN